MLEIIYSRVSGRIQWDPAEKRNRKGRVGVEVKTNKQLTHQTHILTKWRDHCTRKLIRIEPSNQLRFNFNLQYPHQTQYHFKTSGIGIGYSPCSPYSPSVTTRLSNSIRLSVISPSLLPVHPFETFCC